MMDTTQTGQHHDFVLSVAKEVIECRAARDGHEPGTYNCVEDQEGYIVSLLNALRQWSHVHEIDWEAELKFAQGLFRADLGVPDTPATLENMACPKCGHKGSFYVEVSSVILFFEDGDTVLDDTEEQWNDYSYCGCHACNHDGRVYQFRTDSQQDKENTDG